MLLKAAAEAVKGTKVRQLRQFIPWSSGSWKFGPTPEELAFQALESFSEVGLSAYSDSSLQAASLNYRGIPPIRNSQFPIWAKGEGVLGPSKTAILKKYTFIKG